MSDAVEIAFRADLSDLESGVGDALALLDHAAAEMTDAFAPRGDSRAGGEARRIADETLRIDEQTSLKEIAIAENRNDFLYRLGEESLDQWKAEALAEENARYSAELSFLDKKTAADKGDAAAEARDLEQRALLYQEHELALQKIDERYTQDKRAQEQEVLQDAIAADNARLASGLRALDADFRAHRIGADQRYTTMQGLVSGLTYWDLLQLNSGSSRTLLGSGTLLISDGVTENPTAKLPSSTPVIGLGVSDIQLTAGNASLVLTLQPGGPPGTAGTSVVDSAGPPPLPTNFQFYRDTNDGWLKVISAAGNVYQLFPT